MIEDRSISEWEPYCRYWLVFHYGNGHSDVIMWNNNYQRLLEAWEEKNLDCYEYEGFAPYGIACNISAF